MSARGGWFTTGVRRHPSLAGLTVAYVAVWTAYGLVTGTGQVYTYLAWMICAVGLVMYVDRRVRFSTHVLVLLCIVGFCHMAGGNVYIEGVILYEQTWWGYIRYDHLVHAFGLGSAGLAVWEATRRMLSTAGPWSVAVVVVLGANTVGACIESGEYLASLLIPGVRVGGYANNMQDLIANLARALVAAWWAARASRRTHLS